MNRDEAIVLADKLLALINSQPRTPTREQLADVIEASVLGSCYAVSGMQHFAVHPEHWRSTDYGQGLATQTFGNGNYRGAIGSLGNGAMRHGTPVTLSKR